MKHLVILFVFISLAIATFAQNSSDYDAKLDYDQTYHYLVGAASDTIGLDSTWTFTYWKLSDNEFKQYFEMKLDSVSGTSDTITIQFQSKKYRSDTWTTDSTLYWYATIADTTIVYEDTNKAEPFRRVALTGQADGFTAKVNYLWQLFQK